MEKKLDKINGGIFYFENGKNPKITFQSPTFDEDSAAKSGRDTDSEKEKNDVPISKYRGPPVYQTSVRYDEDCESLKNVPSENCKSDVKEMADGRVFLKNIL